MKQYYKWKEKQKIQVKAIQREENRGSGAVINSKVQIVYDTTQLRKDAENSNQGIQIRRNQGPKAVMNSKESNSSMTQNKWEERHKTQDKQVQREQNQGTVVSSKGLK